MSLGKKLRLGRLFAHPSGRLCSVAAGVVQSGAAGLTVGRNVWGFPDIAAAVRAFKAVIHEGKSAVDALKQEGLADE